MGVYLFTILLNLLSKGEKNLSESVPWFTRILACSRRSDSRAQEKNSRRKKKNEGRVEEERGSRPPSTAPFPAPSRFPGVQFNSLSTDRRVLLSEHLEQAMRILSLSTSVSFLLCELFSGKFWKLAFFGNVDWVIAHVGNDVTAEKNLVRVYKGF